MAKARGCGTRVPGGIYLETPLSPHGKPVEEFLIDPPVKIDPIALGVSPIGVKLIEKDGVWHVLDWVGSLHHLNVADFVEEVKRMGLSRRVARGTDFSLLTPQSRLMLIHSRASIDNWPRLADAFRRVGWCPRALPAHEPTDAIQSQCIDMCWQDLKGAEPDPAVSKDAAMGAALPVVRRMPWGAYDGWSNNLELKHSPALFASFPIWQVTVIRDHLDGTHVDALEAASASSLPIAVQDD